MAEFSGQFVTGVTAFDRDIGINGRVEYSLIGADAGRFSIDRDRGIVTLSQPLSGNSYTCQILAVDKVCTFVNIL